MIVQYLRMIQQRSQSKFISENQMIASNEQDTPQCLTLFVIFVIYTNLLYLQDGQFCGGDKQIHESTLNTKNTFKVFF